MNVLVIFSSCDGTTERLALAAAVGAVQARANIRLRRLPDQSSGNGEDLIRMRREYLPPTAPDAVWADAIIIAINRKVSGRVLDVDQATAFGRNVVAGF
jgi:NAD(P)H dehydrogenase (quinone)